MALISMRQLLDHAAEHGYGMPAFNVNNMEQVHAIMRRPTKPTARSSCRVRRARVPMPASPSCAT